MKLKKTKAALSILSLIMLCGTFTGCSCDTKITWTHYAANAPTETSRGNVEFWVNDDGHISLIRPGIGTIVEGTSFDPDKYSDNKDIWIENELKITKGSDSLIIPLNQLPDVYYNSAVSYSDADLKIIKDVTLDKAWTALGTKDSPFTGSFDGNNKTISNLTISTDKEYQGLFGVANGASFKNVKLSNVAINASGLTGGLVGFINGGENVSIENCHVLSGTIKSTLFDDLGGLVGGIYNPTQNVIIKDCSNAARVESTVSPGRVGGIVGLAGSQKTLLLENCSNSGVIVGKNSAAMVGGTRGQAQGAEYTFKNCSNTGEAKAPYVGFFNSSASSADYISVKIEHTAVSEAMLPTLFSVWQSGGTEGGILTVSLNGATYKYFLIPTYTYSVSQGKIVSLEKVNNVEHPMNQTTITQATSDEWAELLAINPKAAIYNEDGTFKGVSPTTNCYAPNSYYIKGSQFGGFINTWVKVISE